MKKILTVTNQAVDRTCTVRDMIVGLKPDVHKRKDCRREKGKRHKNAKPMETAKVFLNKMIVEKISG